MSLSRLDKALIGAARAHRRRAAALLAPLGLHPGQDVLLTVLRRRPTATQAQLARILRVEPPTLAVMVRRLEAAGLVDRTIDPSDARVKVVRLTDHGRSIAEQADRALGGLSDVVRASLSDQDAARLTALLEQLSAKLDGDAEQQ